MHSELHDYLVDFHLWPPGQVEVRGILQHHAVRHLEITANEFTKEKNKLLQFGQLNPTFHKVGTQFPTQVLSKGKPNLRKLKNLTEVLQERSRLLRPQQVGAAGETYCRAIFKRLKYDGLRIRAITPKHALGYEGSEGSRRRADLRFWYTDRHGVEYRVLVENRNRNEYTYPTNGKYFANLIEAAMETCSQPVLMASYLPERSVTLCQAIGIAVYTYGRQFIDSQIATHLKQLYPADLHKELFQFVNLRQPFANYPTIDKRSLNDLNALSDCSWIEDAHDQWLRMKRWLPIIAKALMVGDVRGVDGMLDAHA